MNTPTAAAKSQPATPPPIKLERPVIAARSPRPKPTGPVTYSVDKGANVLPGLR